MLQQYYCTDTQTIPFLSTRKIVFWLLGIFFHASFTVNIFHLVCGFSSDNFASNRFDTHLRIHFDVSIVMSFTQMFQCNKILFYPSFTDTTTTIAHGSSVVLNENRFEWILSGMRKIHTHRLMHKYLQLNRRKSSCFPRR